MIVALCAFSIQFQSEKTVSVICFRNKKIMGICYKMEKHSGILG